MGVQFQRAGADGIARVTLTSPAKLNAMSVAMWRALRAAFDELNAAPGDARVVLVAGEGGQFASGGDIEEYPRFRLDARTLAQFHEEDVLPALVAMRDCELPMVAQIDGVCIGGGLEIAACCDIRIAGTSSRFGVPIARLGFPMAPAEMEILASVVGPTVLRELLLEARVFRAQEAFERGIVTRVVPDDVVAAEALAAAQRMAGLSPQALRLNKRALRQFVMPALSRAADRAPHYAYAPSAEHREGLAAFNEKRTPRF